MGERPITEREREALRILVRMALRAMEQEQRARQAA